MNKIAFKNELRLGKSTVGIEHSPYIVAEMSGNHNQSLEKALKIVEAAAKAGANAIKIQTYTADTMTLNIRDKGFVIEDPDSLWAGKTLYELYDEAHTPWEWHDAILERCRQLGIDCFSTPFDFSAVDFLEQLSVPFYKVASFENTDLPLIQKIAQTGKPVIVSLGMASEDEIQDIINTMNKAKNDQLILLKCTSSYPAEPVNSHLRTIVALKEKTGALVGLSDHTLGVGAAVASVALGACFIEKHFTLDRSEGGVDSAFSLEPNELKTLVQETHRAWQSLGEECYGPTESEKPSLNFRRSLYIVKDLKKGDVLTSENLRAIRPGYGLSPKYYQSVLGKKIKADASRGTPLQEKLIDVDDC